MNIDKLDEQKKEISISIPLTNGTGKTRVKRRSILNEYGYPVPTKTKSFSQDCYIEWQIGYDVEIKNPKKLVLTTLKNL